MHRVTLARLRPLPLLALSLALCAGAAEATRYPLVLTDDLGRKVTVRAEPARIVSVLPSNTETLCAIGACGKLVAVDDFSLYPKQAAALPKVGGLYDANVERIVSLKPALAILSKYGKLADQLDRLRLRIDPGVRRRTDRNVIAFDAVILEHLLHADADRCAASRREVGE